MYDKEIRESLFFFLEEVYGKCRIIEEKVIGKARADSLLVTEEAFIGVEIKSDQVIKGSVHRWRTMIFFLITISWL